MRMYDERPDLAMARGEDNEILGSTDRHIRLMMDSSNTNGAVSAQRVLLRAGDPGRRRAGGGTARGTGPL
jgi:hypothetical protein